jgi:hypothetical protein
MNQLPRRGPMRRRYSWDERQGDLFGASAPKSTVAKRPVPTKTVVFKEPLVQPVSLTSLAQRSSRIELEDMVNELGDEELAHLIVRGVRILKKRLARAGQGWVAAALSMGPGRARWIEHCRRLRANFPASMNQTQTGRRTAVTLFCLSVSGG